MQNRQADMLSRLDDNLRSAKSVCSQVDRTLRTSQSCRRQWVVRTKTSTAMVSPLDAQKWHASCGFDCLSASSQDRVDMQAAATEETYYVVCVGDALLFEIDGKTGLFSSTGPLCEQLASNPIGEVLYDCCFPCLLDDPASMLRRRNPATCTATQALAAGIQ